MQAQMTRRVQLLLSLLIFVAATYLIGVTWLLLSQFLGTFLLFCLAWLLAYLLKPRFCALHEPDYRSERPCCWCTLSGRYWRSWVAIS